MSRRLSAIRFAHITAKMPSPLDDADFSAVWDGIRRTHSTPANRALPIHPPLLWECLEAIPTTSDDGTPLLAGIRDRAVLLIGFVGALRVSELADLDVEHIETHEKGLVLHIPRSKVNQIGAIDELVVLPRSTISERCPVEAIKQWRRTTNINTGPLLRGLTKSLKPRSNRNKHRRTQHHRQNRSQSNRHRPTRLQLPLPTSRIRHLRIRHRTIRPRHRPPNQTPITRQHRNLRTHTRRLDKQRSRRTPAIDSRRAQLMTLVRWTV
jgi:integrase